MSHIFTTSTLGVRVSAITYEDALREIERWITEKKRSYVCVAATHLVMECQKDTNLHKGVNNAGLVTPDGMPLVWLLRLYGYKNVQRVYGPTLMQKVCQLSVSKKWRVFLLGGAPGESQEVARTLVRRLPRILIVGTRDTPIRPIPHLENIIIRNEIEKANPEIVFIGSGCPWQEKWMIENRKQLSPPVFIGVGAAFNFFSGRARQAPEWMQHAGLEWLYRLIREPKRLWYRYTITNLMFICRVCKQILSGRFKDQTFI